MEISGFSECAKCGYTPSRKRWTGIVLVLLQFLVTYAQGQGPGTNFSVFEGKPPGTIVGNLIVQPSYTYYFNEPQSYFSLNPTNGEISTKVEIDRELLKSDRLNILVISRPPGNTSQIPIDIYITVLDKNDNSPTFPESPVQRDISEKANIGYKIRLDTATDKDIGKNGNVTNYQIIKRNDDGTKFKTVFDPSKFGQVLYLELISSLDREEKDSYEITIRANDQGDTPLFGDLIVQIQVTDANDNPPIFSLSQYTAIVNESSPIDTLVIQVDATDDDIGENGNIFYTMTDESQQFKIDERTGEIRTIKTPLHCHCGESQVCSPSGCISLTLEAHDGGNPTQNGRAYVTVSIKDENDHAPTINIMNQGPIKDYISVNETAKNGDLVVAITVSDADTGMSANISSVKIVAGNELNHFRLNSFFQFKYNVLLVNVNGLDRERIDTYNLSIQAVDMGSPPKVGTKNLIIVVADVNEFPPTFLQQQYVANVLETLPIGSFIANLVAEDKDSGINAQLTYKILSGNDHGWFEINSRTGLVTLRGRLKYNLAAEIIMNISVQDGASVPLISYTKLTVRISDENDVTPTFSQSSYQVHLLEEQQLGTEVISLTAEDSDSGLNGSVLYSFHREVQELYPDTFNVNSLSGRVITLKKLDRETLSHYELKVIARDQSVVPLSSTATIYLTVDDENDNVPIFYPQMYFANVLKSATSGTKVVKVTAMDPDLGDGGRIYYSFPNDHPEFVLDTNTGWISTTYEFESSSVQEYTLQVTCRDTNTVHRAVVNAVVKISVLTSLSSLPVFTKSSYQFTVKENLAENQILGSVAVSSGISPTYALTDGDNEGSFRINAQQGEISTSRSLDREHRSHYELTVTAKTQDGTSEVKVNVIVTDANDNKPAFKYNFVEIELPENSAVGHEVYCAFAVDEDAGSNGLLSYALTANTNFFQINQNTGMITMSRQYQKYYGTKFNLTVTASDSGSPSSSSSMVVQVSITDVNDHNPVFPKTDYAITLEESTLVNTQFHTLTATDADVGRNAALVYNITKGNDDGKFGIFPDGKLYIAKQLDRETRDLYKLTVMAQDHGILSRSSEVNVTIHILDSNDNRPRFLNQTYSFYVSENVPPGQKIGAVKAFDADIGRNAELAFLLAEDQDNFTIDFQTGEITTLKSYDRETLVSETGKDYYSVVVTVVDNGVQRQHDSVTAHIYILDQNDNPPQFDRDIYRTSVKENIAKYSFVYKVTATDLDVDENAALTYSIVDGNTEDMFNINPGTGQISLNGNLDTETLDLYSLQIQAADNGKSKTFTASAMIIISILDVNDNTPLFHLTVYEVNILEDTKLGEKLIQVTADDTDLGINAEIEYSLSESDGTFVLDSHNGNLYLAKLVDFEVKQVYNLKVIATDKGDPRLSSEADLNVRIIDINDNSPEFVNDYSVFSVSESTSVFSSIGQISANDKDSGLYGQVEYHIVSQNPPGNTFNIGKNSGGLRLETPLDREEVSVYMLTVIATDLAPNASLRLTSEKTFSVQILDENDNSPILQSAPAIQIQYPTSQGHIGSIEATDPDAGSNGTIVFQLLSSEYNSLFNLDSRLGKLYLTAGLSQSPTMYKLNVQISDEGRPAQTTTVTVTIILIQSPDTRTGPQFSNTPYSFSVRENVQANVNSVLSSAASVEYYIVNIKSLGNPGYYFKLDKTSGMIQTNGMLDREVTGSQVNLTVCAVNTQSNSPQASLEEVVINIVDENDTPPIFSQTSFVKNVGEDLPVGSEILRITVTDPDTTLGTQSLRISSGNHGNYALNSLTGALTIAKRLDREVRSTDRLTIESSDGTNTAVATVKVNITDINDNAPVFTEVFFSFDVPEDTPVGTTVGLVEAVDADEGLNGEVVYTLVSTWGQSIFHLDPQMGTISLSKRVDFEQNHLFSLTILASDKGSPSQSTSLLVFLNVKDVNDNEPQFDHQTYSGQVPEDAAIGTSVLTVQATDIDSGINSQLRYTLLEGNSSADFSIGTDNGTIYVLRSLDREVLSQYSLIVIATDQAKPSSARKSTAAEVTVSISDVNDNSPEFITPSQIWVKENATVGSIVYTVRALDIDEGVNANVMYSLVSHPVFSIAPSTGQISLSSQLNRELIQNYTLQVTATDQGTNSRSTTQKLVILVEDINDNPPLFVPSAYSKTVREDVQIGTTLLQVTATDSDAGLNGVVRFFIISGDDNADFSMDPSSGVLRVQKNLDYERVKTYTLKIQAEDMGVNPRYSVATVTIQIEDVNDFQPVFQNSPYYALVRENMAASTAVPVISLSAVDLDSALNSQLTYTLREGDKGVTSIFQINPQSGEITCNQTLDREQVPQYKVLVVAIDSGTNRLTGTGTVYIEVEDVNDNAPMFDRSSTYVGHVAENQEQHQDILTVTATDADSGPNAQISYNLLDDVDGKFAINTTSGVLTSQKALDREDTHLYHLTVVVKDHGSLAKSSEANITIYVDDLNDNIPSFEKQIYNQTLNNPTSSGQFVVGVTAVDRDVGANGRITYQLQGCPKFSMDSQRGVITTANFLSGGGTQFTCTIEARDQGSPSLMSTTTLLVVISSTSASSMPAFDAVGSSATLNEGAALEHVVVTVSAQSASSGGVIRYSIAGGNVGNTFRIEQSSGIIRVAGEVDYEMTPNFRLWIQATEGNNLLLSAYKEVVINIIDQNDNTPRFQEGVYITSVKENIPINTDVYTVNATDADSGENGRVVYVLASGNVDNIQDTFSINSVSGVIQTKVALDRETQDSYSLIIEAHDMGTTQRTGTTTVRVTLIDVNDNSPTFSSIFSVSIPEDLPVNSFIIQVTSTDPDIGINAKAHYSIDTTANYSSLFHIDANSGNITLKSPIDREALRIQRIGIPLIVDDGSYSTRGYLYVFVSDVNDNAPQIQPPVTFNFLELQPVGSTVGRITALDNDVTSPNNISYFSFKLPSSEFAINDSTGVITSKEKLTYIYHKSYSNALNQRELVVIATDLGTPAKSSEAIITIEIIDANDHAPVFEQDLYFSAVPETAPPGERILTVSAQDKLDFGQNAEVEYFIESGNGSSYFFINRTTGLINVALQLSGKRNQDLMVTIRAEDKGMPPKSATVPVHLSITAENSYTPVFQTTDLSYNVQEDAPIGQSVTRVTATDQDGPGPNGKVSYYILNGNAGGLFKINSENGVLSVAKALDYDTSPNIHLLNVSARDSGLHYREVTTILTIQLTDVNDNPPLFTMSHFEGYIPENSPSDSSIIKIQAKDIDTGENARIEYYISQSGSDQLAPTLFKIDKDTGTLMTKGTLDYETQTEYSMVIIARNPNNVNMRNSAKVTVHVTSMNEFYPEFEQKTYAFSTKESAANGSVIGNVRATDRDKGIDGIVYYYLIGASNVKGFSVNYKTGDIFVSGKPDYESSPHVVLNVLAKNWESVKGNDTDTCTVTISVEDANDAPVFTQTLYEASVPENSAGGVSVTTVTANDRDNIPEDRLFSYRILSGGEEFSIDSTSGRIHTTGRGQLDRETNDTHSIVVGAVDRGTPPATGSATVRITLLDENDNPPYFTPVDLSGSVRENMPVGTRVIELAPSTFDQDLDLTGNPGNRGPFTYQLSADNAGDYFVVSTEGVVVTKQILDREAPGGSQHSVIVIVRDAGKPTQSATLTFMVIVEDANDSPPQARNMDIQIGIFETTLPTVPVADVRPLDADTIGTYTCTVTDEYYAIPAGAGCSVTLRNFHTPLSRTLHVQGSDGNTMVSYNVISTLVYIDNATLDNVVIIYVDGVGQKEFVKDKLDSFRSSVANLFSSEDRVTVLNVDSKDTGTLAYVSVVTASGTVVLHDILKQQLNSNKQAIAGAIFPNVVNPENRVQIGYSVCEISTCNSGTCLNRIIVGSGLHTLDSPAFVLSSPVMVPDFYCSCPSQYTGRYCDVPVQPCGGGFCSNGGYCQSGVCQCQEGWFGQNCTQDKNECTTSPCLNGGTCDNTPGSYTCQCPDGYTGQHCETGSNHCASNPCENGGQCKNELEGFHCQCPYEFWGNKCQYVSKGFSRQSYMEFNSIDQNLKDIDLDLTLSTIKTKGLLLYNPSNTGKFIALEIFNKNVRFSFNFGDAKATVLTVLKNVSTGEWYRVQVQRRLAVAELRVTHCPATSAECATCQDGDPSCYSKGSQSNNYLDLDGHPMFLGGLKDIETIQTRPGQIRSHDFEGCIREFRINNVDHLTAPPSANRQENILNKCPRSSPSGHCRPDSCKNGALCVEEWEGFTCHCTKGFLGTTCEIASGPLGFGSTSRISLVQKESYRRDQILNQLNSRKRRAVDTSSVMIRYRATAPQEPLLTVSTANNQGVLWVGSGKLVYTFGSTSVVLNSAKVHNGEWHNATVSVTGEEVSLRLDDDMNQGPLSGVVRFSDVAVTKMVLGSSENPINVDNSKLQAFSGCISQLQIDGSFVPLNGSTERFMISPTGSVESGCTALCAGDPCGGGTCTITQEVRVCSRIPKTESLSIGIIVVIVFFGVLLIVIAIVFVLFRMRRQKRDPKNQNGPKENGHVNKSYNNTPPSHQDSGYGENDYNRQNNLNATYTPNGLHRPDLINSDPTQRKPYEIDDGTVIIDNGDVNMNQLNDMPEHYDLDNASSIAPSDIDVHMHYRGYRSGYYPDRSRERPHKRHKESPASGYKSRESPGPGALKMQTSGRLRSSPANNLEVPQIPSHSARSSPANVAMRNSPINQLSRQSPQVRASPLIHSNVRGTPVSNIHHSRTESEQSLASHHSKSSTSSSVPRTVLPNGHVKSGRHKYYDPNSRQVKGLTVEEIDKLNARPRRPSPVSMLEAVSSSEEGRHMAHIRMSTIPSDTQLVPPESSSEDSANDSFTCSEFEYENEKTKNEFDPNAMIFSKVSEVDNEHEDSSHQNRTSQSDGLDSNGGSFASTVGSSEEGPHGEHKLLNGHFAWDYLMNWGPSYEKLVGVFKDIASLPDGEMGESQGDQVAADCEEYV